MEKTGSGNDFELIPQNDNSKIDVTEGKQHNVGQPINEAMASEVIDIDGKDESSDGDDDDDDDDDDSNIVSNPDNCFSKKVREIQTSIYGFFHKYKRQMKIGLYAILLILYTVYFGYAMYYSFKNAIALFAMTVFAVLCVAYMSAKKYFGDKIKEVYQPIIKFVDKHWNIVRWLSAIVTAVLVIIWIIMDTSQNPENLMSLIGVFAILLFCFLFSKHPDKVRWRPVIWGLVLQILFALMILRTRWGVVVFRYLGDHVTVFLEYTQIGAKFVFGDLWKNHYFAFEVMPMVLYLAAVISFLYHIGVIQIVITKLAWILQFTMHTSASESLATAAAIFLSMVEAPMLVGPYMSTMTVSELHAVATAGYTTIAGSIFGAAISFGISPSHVITASVMSAPAALAVSKLFYPETEKEPSSRRYKSLKINLPKYQNAIEALAQGAMKCVPVVVNVCVNFIVILAVLAFLNACLSWAGSMVGHPEFSFELICSWVFMPVAYLMGVDGKDCFIVGELIGMKIVTSVLVSYKKMSVYLKNRELGLEPSLSPRSELIATYALCGFSHIAAIGMTMGTFIGLAPNKTKDINDVVVRAMIAGNAANFLTACIAGILYQEADILTEYMGNSTLANITDDFTTAVNGSL